MGFQLIKGAITICNELHGRTKAFSREHQCGDSLTRGLSLIMQFLVNYEGFKIIKNAILLHIIPQVMEL